MKSLFLTPSKFDHLVNRFENQLFDPFSSMAARKFFNEDIEAWEKNLQTTVSSKMFFDKEKSSWEFMAELPGIAKENLKIDLKEDLLTISGEKTKGVTTGAFEHSFKLPQGCDVDKIEAEFSDGVLHLKIPLLEKKSIKTITLK